MECIKDYLTGKFEEAKEKIISFQNIIEDLTEGVNVERKLKGFLTKKVEDLEAKLHSVNSHVMRDAETINVI